MSDLNATRVSELRRRILNPDHCYDGVHRELLAELDTAVRERDEAREILACLTDAAGTTPRGGQAMTTGDEIAGILRRESPRRQLELLLAIVERERREAAAVHSDLTSRLGFGFGDGITEPQASNDVIVDSLRDHVEEVEVAAEVRGRAEVVSAIDAALRPFRSEAT